MMDFSPYIIAVEDMSQKCDNPIHRVKFPYLENKNAQNIEACKVLNLILDYQISRA